MTTSSESVQPIPPGPASRRRKWLVGVAATVAVAAGTYGTYFALVLNHYASTDNAYVQGNLVQITPQVSGTVVSIDADDTDLVKAGQGLVKLDTADAQVAHGRNLGQHRVRVGNEGVDHPDRPVRDRLGHPNADRHLRDLVFDRTKR